MLLDRDFWEPNHQNQVREQGSVPFEWEEKPGLPKKDCKAEAVMVYPRPPPMKLAASVPFKWEKKPGTPLIHTQSLPSSPLLPLPPGRYNGFPSPLAQSPNSSPNPIRSKLSSILRRKLVGKVSSKTPGFSSTKFCDYRSSVVSKEQEEEDDGNDEDGDGDGDDGDDEMFELDLEGFTFNDDSSDRKHSDSSPSLLANCLMTTAEMSNAVPVDQSLASETWNSQKSLIWNDNDRDTSETDYNSSSSSTGTASGISSHMEFRFPLFSPDSSFLDKVCSHVQSSPAASIESSAWNRNETNPFAIVRRTPTLGELIAMSRRNHSKHALPVQHVIPVKKQSSSLEFFKEAFACCIPYDDEQWIFEES